METIRRRFIVERSDIAYIRVTVESYDGMAVVRTIDPRAALIELQIAPGCEDMIMKLLDHLSEREAVPMVQQPQHQELGS